MTALSRVRAALAAGERPSDDDVRAVCADAGRLLDALVEMRNEALRQLSVRNEYQDSAEFDLIYDAAIREPK